MKKLIVIYDKEEKDKGRDSYIKAIKKAIPEAEIYDKYEPDNKEDCEKVLILKPMKEDYYKALSMVLEKMPWLDVEGQFSGELTITAEAILETIWSEKGNDLKDKTIVIVNQSEILGKPLAKELIDLGATVMSINSNYISLDNLLSITDVDVLVSASGKYEYKIDRELTRFIDVKIDLSDDLGDPIKITTVPTVEVLKERLEEWKRLKKRKYQLTL